MSKVYIPVELRNQVFSRAHGICEYCHALSAYTMKTFEMEHIIPLSKGGRADTTNLALACGGCNSYKNNKTEWYDPYDRNHLSLFNPRVEKWLHHFKWSEDYNLILGLTPTGRATIDLLKMNRVELVNLRNALRLIGKHPPFSAHY